MAPPVPLTQCRRDLVESALAGPWEGFGDVERHPSLSAKAAVLAYRIAKSHACPDGNKRLALILASAFLQINEAQIDASTDETEHVFKYVSASSAADYDETLAMLTHWFEQTIRPLADEEE